MFTNSIILPETRLPTSTNNVLARNVRIIGTAAYYDEEREMLLIVSSVSNTIYIVNIETLKNINKIHVDLGISAEQYQYITYFCKFFKINGELLLVVVVLDGFKVFKINLLDKEQSVDVVFRMSAEEWKKRNYPELLIYREGYINAYVNGSKLCFLSYNLTLICYDIITQTVYETKSVVPRELEQVDNIITNYNNIYTFFYRFQYDINLAFYDNFEQRIKKVYNVSQLFPEAIDYYIRYSPSTDLFVMKAEFQSLTDDILLFFDSDGDYLYNLTFSGINERIFANVAKPINYNTSWLLLAGENHYYKYYTNNKTIEVFCELYGGGFPSCIYWLQKYNKFLFYGRSELFLYNVKTKQVEYIYENIADDNVPIDYGNIIIVSIIGVVGLTSLFTLIFLYFVKKK